MYCDFYSINNREDSIPEFIQSLISEIERCEVDTSKWEFNTIFIGGGTPSLIKSKYMELIINALHKRHNLNKIKEFTIELNPGEAPKDRLKGFKNLGINRLSIGVQSLEPLILKFLTRIHDVKQVYETFDDAREVGFDNINCDLMYSIPNQSWNTWSKDLKEIINLKPEHISAYALTPERGTQLFKLMKEKKITMPSAEQKSKWFLDTHNMIKSHFYMPYEISSFSKKGYECQHNLNYWKILPYIGYGPSAYSYDGAKRWQNINSIDSYIKKLKSYKSPIHFSETINEKNKTNEIIGFGLRTTSGILVDKIPKVYSQKFRKNLKSVLKKWEKAIIVDKIFIKLNQSGFLFADAIAIDLMI
jgi:oxygen-independent coproporphyrinogen-3 oxidase